MWLLPSPRVLSTKRIFLLVSFAVALGFALVGGVTSDARAGIGDDVCPDANGEDTNTCPPGQVGVAYSITFKLPEGQGCSPGDDVWSIVAGASPPGLSMSSSGTLSGTPTQAGTFFFFIQMALPDNPNCNGSKDTTQRGMTLTVTPAGTTAPPSAAPKPTIVVTVTTASLPDANLNQPYTSPGLTATGATVTSWTLAGGTLPSGLTLGTNGVITGTPTQSGTFAIKVQANADGASATKDLSLFVFAPLGIQTLVDKTPPTTGLTAKRLVNQPLATGVKAVGGRRPYTFSSEGEMPPGITLDPATGNITGTGTTSGRYAFTVTITDATGAKASVPWNITILPLLSFAPNAKAPAAGHLGSRYHWIFKTTGASRTRTFVLSGKRPPGLTFDRATGTLAGTPTRKGNYRITIRVVGDSATVIQKSFTIRIR
jgi:large repetitive protein